ncbi:MAG: polysaccharide deacetylase family protein, partial [Bacteroidota bacterium]
IYSKKKGIYQNKKGISLKQFCKSNDWAIKAKIYDAFPKVAAQVDSTEWKPYWQPLSDQEIVQLAASPYAEVGLHAYYHDNLGRLPSQQAVALIDRGKQYLEQLLQQPIRSFAYADGSYNTALTDYLQKIGVKEQYIVDYLQPEDRKDERIKNRLTINPYTSLVHQVYAILNGRY